MAKNPTAAQAKETEQTVSTNRSSVDQSKVDKFKAQLEKLYEDHKNHSGVIRYLASQGLTTSEIHHVTGKRYQHVRNVLIVPVGKNTAA